MQEKIYIGHIEKAYNVFEKFRQNLNTDQEKTGAIKAFEYCYELAWKMMKRVLESRGLEAGSPKDTFRKAFEEKLIDNPEVWFEFQKLRNLSVHTYNEENLDIITSDFDTFSEEMQKLIKKLKSIT
jgi:nucleotidyltransferase substrate binding protein (TIGR01987 family)